jgi:hypothetical protein
MGQVDEAVRLTFGDWDSNSLRVILVLLKLQTTLYSMSHAAARDQPLGKAEQMLPMF